MLELNSDDVVKLAPDEASVKAARGLNKVSKWQLLAYSNRVIWGECKGSGSKPYQTIIDTQAIAQGAGYRCSCPSRKFPCKHVLALLLLLSESKKDFTQEQSEPDFIKEWIDKRDASAQKKIEKAKAIAEGTYEERAVDIEAQKKRLQARHKKVSEGIKDLEIWLKDLMRNGLINIKDECYTFNQNMGARLIDAQAPSLAQRVKKLSLIDFNQESWKEILTREIGNIYLLCQAYKNIDNLDENWQGEIRRLIGFPLKKEEVLKLEGIEDDYLVLSKNTDTSDDNLTTHTYIFLGLNTHKFAYIFVYVPKKVMVPNIESYVVGASYHGKMHFFPGVGDARRAYLNFDNTQIEESIYKNATIENNIDSELLDLNNENPELKELLDKKNNELKQELQKNKIFSHDIEQKLAQVLNSDNFKYKVSNINAALNLYSQYYAINPFANNMPIFIEHMRFGTMRFGTDGFKEAMGDCHILDVAKIQNKPHAIFVIDQDGYSLPICCNNYQFLKYASITTGRSFTGFFSLNNNSLTLLGIYFEGKYYA